MIEHKRVYEPSFVNFEMPPHAIKVRWHVKRFLDRYRMAWCRRMLLLQLAVIGTAHLRWICSPYAWCPDRAAIAKCC